MWPSPVMRIDKVASACHTFMARHAKERMRTRRQQLDAPWCYHVLSPSQECPSFFILDGGRFLQHPRRSSCSPTEMAVCLRCGHVSAGPGQMRKTGTQTHTHTQRCAHFHSDTLNHRTHTFHRTPFPSHTRFRCVCVCPTLLPRGIFFDIADADGRKAGGQESASVCPGQRRPDTAEVQTYLHARSLKPCHAPQFKGPFAKIGLVTEHRAWLNQDVQTNRIGGCG